MTETSEVVDAILDGLIPLAGALGVRQEEAGPDRVVLWMPPSHLVTNHVGSMYAGAAYTLAELTSGALAALASAPDLIPVVVAGTIKHLAPATSVLRCTARRDGELDDLLTRWNLDRRLTSVVTAECSCEDTLVARATFTYWWLGPL